MGPQLKSPLDSFGNLTTLAMSKPSFLEISEEAYNSLTSRSSVPAGGSNWLLTTRTGKSFESFSFRNRNTKNSDSSGASNSNDLARTPINNETQASMPVVLTNPESVTRLDTW